ncbi:unnamed protein product [Adineta steineri]|uniref:Hexosyltransferase n=1 Tax=Adineta steineri TaxID=433720 RepID=A0A818ZX41_9BILA|nr:unnamed protein product [Adineta steineri]CAF3775754.1 unnamed protein product [Adineta steineri]
MRRFSYERICLFVSVVLLIYIGWSIINPSKRSHQDEPDSLQQLAYIRALNTSSPILQNTQLCSFDKIDLLIVIISSGQRFLERQSIRETWRSMTDSFGVHSKHLFVMGYFPFDNLFKDLTNEAAHEQDILFLTVDEELITLKELHAYRWLERYCPNVPFIFKTEDDLFINTLLLHELIRELKTNPNDRNNRYLYNTRIDSFFVDETARNATQYLYGLAYMPGKPERNGTTSPFYVTYQEYPHELYPRYCSGFGYLMNAATKRALTTEGFKDKNPFRFSDIFMTGIIPDRLNFVCEIMPFIIHQGTMEQCMGFVKNNSVENPPPSTTPLLVCSTGRHLGNNAFSDYYRMWTALKLIYANRLKPKNQ